MHSKEMSHLEAILSGAEGYLEANLTNDTIISFHPYSSGILPESLYRSFQEGTLTYGAFIKWHLEHISESGNGMFKRISDKNYLMSCFKSGGRRASVTFSMETGEGNKTPFKIFFYMYRDVSSGDVLAFCVIYDLTEQLRREKEFKELEDELQMSKLRNFNSQMQPHFLYNALGSIQEIILEDPKYASELIGDFTDHLRSCIRSMTSDAPIPFEQELNNIRAYVNIEKMRLGSKLKVEYDIETKDFSILPLSIQPIVENAIRHGVYQRGEKGGTVIIRTREDEDKIRIIVEDDGVGFDLKAFCEMLESGTIDSTGLKNIRFRLDKIMQADLVIESIIGEGTKVTITIPKGGKTV